MDYNDADAALPTAPNNAADPTFNVIHLKYTWV